MSYEDSKVASFFFENGNVYIHIFWLEFHQGIGSGGACCVTALIQDKEVVVSNVGDCRAVLCRGGKAEVLTKDHRAGQEDERRRIEDKVYFLVCIIDISVIVRTVEIIMVAIPDAGRICAASQGSLESSWYTCCF